MDGGAIGHGRALETVHMRDVGVIEGSEELRLTSEASESLCILRQFRGQDLDRHLAIELRVPGPVHLAHSARAERGDDFVRSEALTDHRPAAISRGNCDTQLVRISIRRGAVASGMRRTITRFPSAVTS